MICASVCKAWAQAARVLIEQQHITSLRCGRNYCSPHPYPVSALVASLTTGQLHTVHLSGLPKRDLHFPDLGKFLASARVQQVDVEFWDSDEAPLGLAVTLAACPAIARLRWYGRLPHVFGVGLRTLEVFVPHHSQGSGIGGVDFFPEQAFQLLSDLCESQVTNLHLTHRQFLVQEEYRCLLPASAPLPPQLTRLQLSLSMPSSGQLDLGALRAFPGELFVDLTLSTVRSLHVRQTHATWQELASLPPTAVLKLTVCGGPFTPLDVLLLGQVRCRAVTLRPPGLCRGLLPLPQCSTLRVQLDSKAAAELSCTALATAPGISGAEVTEVVEGSEEGSPTHAVLLHLQPTSVPVFYLYGNGIGAALSWHLYE